MDLYIDRINAFGHIFWLPPQPLIHSVATAQAIRDLASSEVSLSHFMQRLSMRGFNLTLKVNFHGEQTFNEWSVSIIRGTWAERLAD